MNKAKQYKLHRTCENAGGQKRGRVKASGAWHTPRYNKGKHPNPKGQTTTCDLNKHKPPVRETLMKPAGMDTLTYLKTLGA